MIKYENTLPLFASKSFSCKAIYKLAMEYGVGIDCVSAGEISVALKAGFDELYSTAPDYMDKKMQILDEEIERQAYQKANEKVIEAQSEKAKRYQEKERKTWMI